MSDADKQILFVCTGNICRSPMAEYLFRHRTGDKAGWMSCSAGVFALNGSPASAPAVESLREWDIDLTPHQSQPLTAALVEASDLVVVMTDQHRREVLQNFPEAEGRVRLLTSFGTGRAPSDISDPIGASLATYHVIRDQIDSAMADLLLYLAEKKALNLESRPAPDLCLAIGADHGGYDLKTHVVRHLQKRNIRVEDLGCHGSEPVDYPDFASAVARMVSEGKVDQGILICTTGIGMAISANKFPRVRAALCTTPHAATMARTHNNANVLALGASVTSKIEGVEIIDAWLAGKFEVGGRHERRVSKIQLSTTGIAEPFTVYDADPEIYAVLRDEARREREHLDLIASENYASRAVRETLGSVLTNKYAEGYPGKRWYPGCAFVDEAERLAIDRAKELFGAEHANVQPYSGSMANLAVMLAMLEPGDTFLSLDPAQGGHITHGQAVNFSGRLFHAVHYGLAAETEQIDYDAAQQAAEKHQPKMIVAGASSYSRIIDFTRMRKIADGVGAYLLVDMAHVAGLVAAGCYPNPVPVADVVTTSTHKTLRGPRGGMVLCRKSFASDIDRQVFPGLQGGPLMHVVAAKAVCLAEAALPAFRQYGQQTVRNARAISSALEQRGLRIVAGGTDIHLFVADLQKLKLSGKKAVDALQLGGITANKIALPFDDPRSLAVSGIRLGTPAVTTRGMKEPEMESIAELVWRALKGANDDSQLREIREEVRALAERFPVP